MKEYNRPTRHHDVLIGCRIRKLPRLNAVAPGTSSSYQAHWRRSSTNSHHPVLSVNIRKTPNGKQNGFLYFLQNHQGQVFNHVPDTLWLRIPNHHKANTQRHRRYPMLQDIWERQDAGIPRHQPTQPWSRSKLDISLHWIQTSYSVLILIVTSHSSSFPNFTGRSWPIFPTTTWRSFWYGHRHIFAYDHDANIFLDSPSPRRSQLQAAQRTSTSSRTTDALPTRRSTM